MGFGGRTTVLLAVLCLVVSSCVSGADDAPTATIRPFVAWGDSLTYSLTKINGEYTRASPTWLDTVGHQLGVETRNFGVPTQGSAEVAVRQGGLKPLVTVSGNRLPANSVARVAIDNISPVDGWTKVDQAGTMTMHGTLVGVSGTLQHTVESGAESFAFVPDAAPTTDIPVPARSVFSGDDGNGYRDCFQFIWVGANNGAQPNAVVRDIASMVNWLAYPKKYMIIGINPQLNEALSVTYGPRFVDLREWLISDGLRAARVPPTANDDEAVVAGEIPPSLMVDDGIHFTQAAYDVIGEFLASAAQRIS